MSMTVHISILGGEGTAAQRTAELLLAAGFQLAPLAEGEVILLMLPRAREVVEALAREGYRPLRARCYLDFAALRLDRVIRDAPVVEVDWRVLSPTVSMIKAGGGSSARDLALPVLRALGEVEYDPESLSYRKRVTWQFEDAKRCFTERITLEDLLEDPLLKDLPLLEDFPKLARPLFPWRALRSRTPEERENAARLYMIENDLSFPLRDWAKAHPNAYTSLNEPRFEAKMLDGDEFWRFELGAMSGVVFVHAREVIDIISVHICVDPPDLME